MRKPKPFSAILIAAAIFSMSTILMSAFAGSHEDGGDQRPSFLDQIAAGDKEAIGHFFAVNRIEYSLDNFLRSGFHGKFDAAPLLSQFAFLASCIDAHSGHLFIIDTNRKIMLSEKTGCHRSVEVKDVNGDGRTEVISIDSSGGTGFGSIWEHYYFSDDGRFRKGLEYEKSSYETIEGSMIFPDSTDWRQNVYALKETEGKIRFLDVDLDSVDKLAKVSYTMRYAVRNYDTVRDVDGSVLTEIGEAVRKVYGERLGAEKKRVEIWNWNPTSSVYLER
jgi:hypothetical protein